MRIDCGRSLHRSAAACLLAALLHAFAGVTWAANPLDRESEFDIAPQALASALLSFSRQAGLQLVTSSVDLSGRQTLGVRGRLAARAALEKLLEDTGLGFATVGNGTVAIRPLGNRPPNARGSHGSPGTRAGRRSARSPAAAGGRNGIGSLEEIIVTARKREESLQAAPLSLTALTAEALALRNVHTLDDVPRFVPNLSLDGAAALSGGSFNTTIFIRGIGQNDFATFTDPGVGVHVDGVYLGRTIGGTLLAFDLERIEVLRGPQGSVFGRNTIGGAINVVSQAPGEELEGEYSLTLGRFQRHDLKAILNVPLLDGRLLTRLSLASVERDGYARQIDYLTGESQDRGDENARMARVQALLRLNEHAELKLKLDGVRTRQHAAPLTLVRVGTSGDPYLDTFNAHVAPQLPIVGPDGSTGIGEQWITGDPYATYGSFGNYNDLDNWGATATLDAHVGRWTVKSISAYRRLKARFGRDGDNSPYTYRETFNHDSQSQLSQELQLHGSSWEDRLDWLAGVYYFREDSVDNAVARLAVGVYDVTGDPAHDIDMQLYNVNASRSYAAFAQATWRFTERLSMTQGLRFTHDEKRFSGFQYRRNAQQFLVPPDFRLQASWNQLSPKVSLEFQATEAVLFYLSAANGYKSGGFTGRTLRTLDDIAPYSPEKVWSYELGAKTLWFNRRLVANGSVFYNDYEDIQLTVNATPRNFVANAAAGRILGAELEATARLASGLDVNVAAGYLDARYTRLRPCSDFGESGLLQCLPITLDSSFMKAPRWTLSSGAQYRWQLPELGQLTLRADVSYKSFAYQDVGNDPAIAQPGYAVIDAGVTFLSRNARLELALFGTNLGDRRYRISGNASSPELGGLAESTFAPPREWGVTIGYKF